MSDPDDGRYTSATLTDLDWDMVVHAAPGHVESLRHFVLDPLSATQLRNLHITGQRILDQIRPC